MTTQPSLFVSHGSPMLAIEDSAAGRFLDGLATVLPDRPKAIVVASAHYNAPGPMVGGAATPPTIHDFGGFPDVLYRQQYPAAGHPALAAAMVDALRNAGFNHAVLEAENGLDHGVWVPLLRAWPAADIPVVALSVDPRQDAAWHYRVGQALAPLREQGVLVIGSGSFSHNLRELDRRGGDAPASPWMVEFTTALRDSLLDGDTSTALNWRALPEAMRNHPTPEHLYPLYVALGAAHPSHAARQLHRSVEYGALAMDTFAFG